MTSAGIVKIMPAVMDSPADAAVCTMLFSRIVELRNNRNTPIETAAAGIDADTVKPTSNPIYAFAAARIIDRSAPSMSALTVISTILRFATTTGGGNCIRMLARTTSSSLF